MGKSLVIIICLVIIVLSLSGCVAGRNVVEGAPDEKGGVAGFWKGLWHGVISPLTWFISIFTADVNFYEVHNNGGWYDFGFVLGAGIILSGSSQTSRRRN